MIINTKHPSCKTWRDSDAGLNQLRMGLLMDPVLTLKMDFYFKLVAQNSCTAHWLQTLKIQRTERKPGNVSHFCATWESPAADVFPRARLCVAEVVHLEVPAQFSEPSQPRFPTSRAQELTSVDCRTLTGQRDVNHESVSVTRITHII